MIEKTFFVTYLDDNCSIKSTSVIASNSEEALANVYNQIEECVVTLSAEHI